MHGVKELDEEIRKTGYLQTKSYNDPEFEAVVKLLAKRFGFPKEIPYRPLKKDLSA